MGWLHFLQVTLKLLIDWLIDCAKSNVKVRCTNHKQPPGRSSLCLWCWWDLNFIHQLFKLNSSLMSIHVGRGIGQATNLWSKYSLQWRSPNSSALKQQGYTLLDVWSVQVSHCFCQLLPQCEQDFFWCATISILVQCAHSCQSIFQLILQPQTSSVHIHRIIHAVTWWVWETETSNHLLEHIHLLFSVLLS